MKKMPWDAWDRIRGKDGSTVYVSSGAPPNFCIAPDHEEDHPSKTRWKISRLDECGWVVVGTKRLLKDARACCERQRPSPGA